MPEEKKEKKDLAIRKRGKRKKRGALAPSE